MLCQIDQGVTPESEELERKKARLAELEAQLADRELERASLFADLMHFEKKYLDTVEGNIKTYVVLPPSLHPAGLVYRWARPLPLCPSGMPILDPREAGFFPTDQKELPHKRFKRDGVAWFAPSSQALDARKSVKCHTCHLRERAVELRRSEERSQLRAKSSPEATTDRGANHVSLGKEEWSAIWVTQPDAPGQREEKLFYLARLLKGMPHLTDAPAEGLQGLVWEWWKIALALIGTKEWPESWKTFSRAWKRVQVPIGTGAIHEMIRLAAQDGEPAEACAYTRSEVRRLVSICRALQTAGEIRGSNRFFLSCRTSQIAKGDCESADGCRISSGP